MLLVLCVFGVARMCFVCVFCVGCCPSVAQLVERLTVVYTYCVTVYSEINWSPVRFWSPGLSFTTHHLPSPHFSFSSLLSFAFTLTLHHCINPAAPSFSSQHTLHSLLHAHIAITYDAMETTANQEAEATNLDDRTKRRSCDDPFYLDTGCPVSTITTPQSCRHFFFL